MVALAGISTAGAAGSARVPRLPDAPAGGAAVDWADAPDGLIERLVARARLVNVPRGAMVLELGEHGDDVFLVLDGHVRVTLFPVNGREVLIRDLGPGRIFGEFAVLDGSPRSATVVAAVPSRVAAVRGADFRAALEADAAAALWLSRHLARQLRVMTDRLFEFAALNARARLHCHLLRLTAEAGVADDCSRIVPAPTHEMLAAAIGSQRETVTRELGALAAGGLVRRAGTALVVPSVSALSRALGDEAARG